jgi:hypothetical protein
MLTLSLILLKNNYLRCGSDLQLEFLCEIDWFLGLLPYPVKKFDKYLLVQYVSVN